jgi:hypothetical protein
MFGRVGAALPACVPRRTGATGVTSRRARPSPRTYCALLVEFDGRQKYAQAQDLWDEKRREDRIRSMGWEVVRLTRADLRDPATVRRRIERALARAAA